MTYTYSTSGRTEDGAAQSERRANLFVFPSQSNVGVANPMHAAVDDRYYSYYAYDYGGERRLKLTGTNNVVDVNADHMSTHSVLDSPTLYPSAYMVVTSKGYTKHYYAGAERVAARIGGGWSDGPVPLAGNDDSLSARADLLYTQSLGQANGRVLEENEPGCVYGPLVESEGLNATIDEIPNHLQAVAEADCGTFLEAMHQLVEGGPGGPENDVYFYHSDHLGSASWITDSAGQAIQHLQYLPFGEPYVNQRTSNYSERFTFTGKERDEETGYGYFGARYMDHELMTMWLSVDPMADKYPSISPYVYCAWNPVKLTDPDGEEIYPTQTSAKQDRNLAIKLFGKDNVSKIFNRGTQNNPDYVFYVHAPKSIDSRQKVNAIISSRGELRKYEFGGAPRKNVISGTLSLGIQVDLNRLVRANISSIDLVSTGKDAYYSDYYIKTIKEGSANGSVGISVLGISYDHTFSGGDYVDPTSRTNSYGLSVLSVNDTNGDVTIGISVACIIGISFEITSKIIKQ